MIESAGAPAGSGQGQSTTTGAQGTASGGAGVTTGAAATDWTTGLNDEFKGYVQTKGFKDPSMVLDSYRNLEKLLGTDKAQLLRLPQKEDAPEWNEVWSKLGKPAAANEYKVGDDKGDKAFQDWAQKTFFELNIPKKQAEALATKFNEYQKSGIDAQTQNQQMQIQQQDLELKKEWGKAYEQNIAVGKKAVQAFGLDGEMIDKLESAMGYAGVMKFMQQLGSKVGDDSFVSGQGQNGFRGAMSPAQAQSKIQALKGDTDFIRRYTSGDAIARDEMEKLHQFAYPE